MRRITITLNDEVEAALDAFLADQEARPTATATVQAALQNFLARRGYMSPRQPLRITPAYPGSGDPHGSRDHDKILAGIARDPALPH